MADIRALLAAERQSRRISHPHLAYTKSGLICTLCNLNIKSETLWDGHLRSANHRKNALANQDNMAKGTKRKIDDVDADNEPQEEKQDEGVSVDMDSRKKPKSRPESIVSTQQQPREAQAQAQAQDQAGPQQQPATLNSPNQRDEDVPHETIPTNKQPSEQEKDGTQNNGQPTATTNSNHAGQAVDEAEWAAFEAEVAPLAAAAPAQQPDYSSATIVAAPVTTAQMDAQAAEDKRRNLEAEAEAEKEDEGRRLEDEFEVMEEMEERVRRLREKREALKHAAVAGNDTGQGHPEAASDKASVDVPPQTASAQVEEEEDEDEVENDDWYA
ncbi:hypothetical protein ABEF93_003227 [Exophiala dermatitidis]